MKSIFFGLRTSAILIFVMSTLASNASPFFVVIGSFTKQGHARRLVESVQQRYTGASFMFDDERDLYHVYVAGTNSYGKAEKLRSALKLGEGFANAWIYTDVQSFNHAREVIETAPAEYARFEWSGSSASLTPKNNPTTPGDVGTRTSGRSITLAFKAQTATGVSVPGKIMLLNQHGSAIFAFKTGNTVKLNQEGGHKMILSCEVQGYGPAIAFIDFNKDFPSKNIQRTEDEVWEITFMLGKIDANTVTLVYRDMFHKDAAVLQSNTQEKLDLLSDIIKANPYLKVEINAHCPETGRRSLRLVSNDSDYFNSSKAVSRSGNGRFLTAERGRTIRNYVMAKGTHDRISVIGWGEIAPLASVDTSNAELNAQWNERVEVQLKALE